jgi:hypothetical protein
VAKINLKAQLDVEMGNSTSEEKAAADSLV